MAPSTRSGGSSHPGLSLASCVSCVISDLAQDALVAALEQWPKSGVPDNPGAWLMATAKHRAMDHFRRNAWLERKHEELGRELGAREMAVPDLDSALDDNVGDDLLRLHFVNGSATIIEAVTDRS
jgi:predicted RNA polymerase sigma factor